MITDSELNSACSVQVDQSKEKDLVNPETGREEILESNDEHSKADFYIDLSFIRVDQGIRLFHKHPYLFGLIVGLIAILAIALVV